MLPFLQVVEVGIALEGYTRYRMGTELLATISNLQLSAYHEWPGIEITLSAFYRRRRLWVCKSVFL